MFMVAPPDTVHGRPCRHRATVRHTFCAPLCAGQPDDLTSRCHRRPRLQVRGCIDQLAVANGFYRPDGHHRGADTTFDAVAVHKLLDDIDVWLLSIRLATLGA